MGNQTAFSQPGTTQFAISTVFVSINVSLSSEQASSTTYSSVDQSSTPKPSATARPTGLSTNAKIGIGIGAGVGGGGLLAFTIAYSIMKCQRKKKDAGDGPVGGLGARQQQLPGSTGQQDSVRCRLDQAELPASELGRHRSSIFSELEGSPVQTPSRKNRTTGELSPDTTE